MTLFADKEAVVAELRGDRLVAAANRYWPGITLSDDYIYGQLLVAERAVESSLHCYLEPVEILPSGATQEERDAFDDAEEPVRWTEEPGYDMTPDFWQVDRYGFTALRNTPVISIHSVRLVYPRPYGLVWEVPADWWRLDKKPGHLRLFPTGGAALIPFAGQLWPTLLSGASIPQMIQVRYVAGLANCARDWPQIVDLVKKKAVLTIMQDQFLPQSDSQSIDGLSQSINVDVDKFVGQLEAKLDHLRDRLKGVLVR